jgi:exopolysaccharide biosynthesis polyprenyl glycosylphosphotransferase
MTDERPGSPARESNTVTTTSAPASLFSVIEGSAKRGVAARAVSSRPHGAEPAAFLILIDLVALVSAFLTAYAVTPDLKTRLLSGTALRGWMAMLSADPGGEFRPIGETSWVLLVMIFATLFCVQSAGGYRPLSTQSRTRLVLISLLAPLAGLATITLVLFAFRSTSWSRLFIFLFASLSVVELCGSRLLLRWYKVRRIASGFHARNVLLIGPLQVLEWLSTHVANNTPRSEYESIGYLSVSGPQPPVMYPSRDSGDSLVLPCLGAVGDLSTLLVHRPIHEVIAVHGGGGDWLRDVVDVCDYFRVTLRIVPEALLFGKLRDLQLMYHSDPLCLPEIVLSARHSDSTALFIKRLIDLVIAAVLLILLSPLMLLIAMAIKLTTPRLPVLYRWRVVGYNGRRFTGYKFSTMVEDAERRQAELMPRNQMQGPVFKMRDDPRVTPLGRFLRKYSLNELPQIWSVLKGDMSLVGPRPAFPHELERYELWHKRKLTVLPGITCLWQVRGRNRISRFDDWVRMDLEYIDNWSLWLDVKILVRTLWTVVRGSGS